MTFQTFAPTCAQLHAVKNAGSLGNVVAAYRLEGELDFGRLQSAVREVVTSCQPFSFRYLESHGEFQIFISPDSPDGLSEIEAVESNEDFAYAMIRNLASRQFRLDGGAPYLFALLKGTNRHYLVFSCHPALMDRFSLKPLFVALSRAYNGDSLSESIGLDQSLLLEREQALTQGPRFDRSRAFWKTLLGDSEFAWHPPRLETDLSETYSKCVLDPSGCLELQSLARTLGIPLSDLLMLSFHLFLHGITGSDAIATTRYHRSFGGGFERIGFAESKLPLKSVIESTMSARRFLMLSFRLLEESRRYADAPVGEMGPRRISNLLFDRDRLPYDELRLNGVKSKLLPSFCHRVDSEDAAIFYDVGEDASDKVEFHLLARIPQYASGLRQVFQSFLALLAHLPRGIDRPIQDLDMMTDDLRAKALAIADGGPLLTPAVDVMESFARLARDNPDLPALRFKNARLTYRELFTAAGRVSSGLSSRGVANSSAEGREIRIGIAFPRGIEMIQAAFGVLFSGASYVPIDPDGPMERLRFIVEDAGLVAILTNREMARRLDGEVNCACLAIEDIIANAPSHHEPISVPRDAAAYVIYTSGTTGRPKGVVIERGMLSHFMASLEGIWQRGPGTRWLQFANLNFDASVLDLFSPLTHGGECIVAPSEARTDPQVLFELLRDVGITHACIPPAMLPLLPRTALPELQALFCGGEAIEENSARFWAKAVKLGNCYGPTEATVMAMFNPLSGFKTSVQLGKPLPGYQVYLLGPGLEIAPLGGVAEICIGGSGVARGYLGRPELTSQKFVANPYGPGRLYRTGDFGRYRPNGEIEFLGRGDFQVKIRGFRIELGEIEEAISDYAEVAGAYVTAVDAPGGKAVAAWYASKQLAEGTLRARLLKKLPHYMVPSTLVRVDVLPLTANGKIDRVRLLGMAASQELTAQSLRLDPFEERIREVWAETLDIEKQLIGQESHFFRLGGHSLTAALTCSRLKEKYGLSIAARVLFECPVFQDFCSHVRSAPVEENPLPPILISGERSAPVESRLIRLLYSRFSANPADNTYNVIMRLTFGPGVDSSRLSRSLTCYFNSHQLFRAKFQEAPQGLRVVEVTKVFPAIPVEQGSDGTVDEIVETLGRESLGLLDPPLWRIRLIQTRPGIVEAVFTIHHSLFDGWSLNLMMKELARLYAQDSAFGIPVEPSPSWFDYCLWEAKIGTSKRFTDCIEYWQKKMEDFPARVELPASSRHKEPNSNRALAVRFDPACVTLLKSLADRLGVTLPPVLFSLYLVWLWRLSNQAKIACSYPCAGRDFPGTERILGNLVHMAVLTEELASRRSLQELIVAVHRQMIDDKDHLTAAPYDAGIPGLDSLNVIFSLQTGIGLDGVFSDSRFKAEELPSLSSKADIAAIFYMADDGGINGRFEYDQSLFTDENMSSWRDGFIEVIKSAIKQPAPKIGDLEYRSPLDVTRAEKASRGPEFPSTEQSIASRFSAIAFRFPDRPAILFDGHQTSYAELDAWSDEIAWSIQREVASGAYVGISLKRGESLVASLLGVLKAGCAFVPLDPSYPIERLRHFIDTCEIPIVLGDESSRETLDRLNRSEVKAKFRIVTPPRRSDALRANQPALPACSKHRDSADLLAYVIFTSGSTGVPKGVMIENRAVVTMLSAIAAGIDFTPGCTQTWVASLNFDASVYEIFLPLLNGGRLAVIDENSRKDPASLHRSIRDCHATHSLLTPVLLTNLPREPLPELKVMAFGGDALDEPTARYWGSNTRLFSMYGPTETTVIASCGEISPGSDHRVIGRPLPGYRIYLLGSDRQPVPYGAIGEIAISSPCVARGYIGQTDLTFEKFTMDPYAPSPYSVMYLTGDLGRYNAEGTIEFHGRNDQQIKLRGFRIELGEVEGALASLGPDLGIQESICAIRGSGEARSLVAYYVSAAPVKDEVIRDSLAGRLPNYMVPSFFRRLARFPQTPNGKVDRKALPEVAELKCESPPLSGLETDICRIWEDLLQIKGIARNESFFHLGGNSLLAVRMQTELKRRLGLEIGIGDFYRSTATIEALARGATLDHREEAIRDSEERIVGPIAKNIQALREPRRVLLTGASGFLGNYLLKSLIESGSEVFCLSRHSDFKDDPSSGGVRFISGDLSLPDLGLAAGMRKELSESVDAILHCGATVHHLQSYSSLRAANVLGTRALLEIALENRVKPFCYISTETAAAALEGADNVPEEVSNLLPAMDNGYLLSKWVGERLTADAAKRLGLPALIVRPGNITGDSLTGFSNFASNHFWLFVKGCLQLGLFPAMATKIEMTPVDLLAKSIVKLFLGHRSGLFVSNLSNPESLTAERFCEIAAVSGFPLRVVQSSIWQQKLDSLPLGNALTTIREFYLGDLSRAPVPIRRDKTIARLREFGISLPSDYAHWVPKYLVYLAAQGFISRSISNNPDSRLSAELGQAILPG